MIHFFDEYSNYQTKVFLTHLLFGTMNIEIIIWNGWSYANIRIQVFSMSAFGQTYGLSIQQVKTTKL